MDKEEMSNIRRKEQGERKRENSQQSRGFGSIGLGGKVAEGSGRAQTANCQQLMAKN